MSKTISTSKLVVENKTFESNVNKSISNRKVIHKRNRFNKSNRFDPKFKLHNKYVIKCAGNHLYLSGLSLYKFGDKNRSKLFNPIIILTVNCLIVFRSIVSLIIPESHKQFHIYLGDFVEII